MSDPNAFFLSKYAIVTELKQKDDHENINRQESNRASWYCAVTFPEIVDSFHSTS